MIIDSNVLIGHWPFRKLPLGDASAVRKILIINGINQAMAGSLESILFRNVQDGNEILYQALEKDRDFFAVAPTINPSYAQWEKDYRQALREGAAAVRIYPEYQNWNLLDTLAHGLYHACEEDELPLILTAEIEDFRQRHPLDKPKEWLGAEVRLILEQREKLRVIIVNARAERVREISLTLSEEKRKQVFFDISALWGPFVDDLALCVEQVGISQFVFGSHAVLKTPETAATKLRLSRISEDDKKRIYSENIIQLIPKLKF